MKKSYKSILLLFVVMILAMSAVSAADADDTSDSAVQAADEAAVDEVASADVDDVVSTDDAANVLADPAVSTSKNFTTLQSDIDNANGYISLQSDYLKESDEGVVTIAKDITINGDNHKIDANKNGGIFKIESGYSVTLMNVILINGNTEKGGAIYNDGSLNFISSQISDSNASVGGAIYNTGILTISSGSTLDGNTATTLGGAVYNEGTAVADQAIFTNNKVTTASYYNPGVNSNGGAAIFTAEGSSLDIDQSSFTGNSAPHDTFAYFTSGGAIYVYRAATTTIDDCTFENNDAGLGGAIIFEGFSQDGIALSNSRFTNNSAWQGGAVNVNEFVGNLVMTGNTFTENKAVGPNLGGSSPDSNPASAGAISVGTMSTTGTTVEISDSDFIGNTAVNGGAVVVNENTEVAIQNCSFIANVVSNSASAISSSGKVNINESRFKQNKGSLGTLYLYQSEYSVTNCNFTNNDDPWGEILNNGGTLTLKNNYIDRTVGILSWGSGSSVVTDYKITILNNGSYEINQETYNVSAVITDDNKNIIHDYVGGHFKFVIDGKETTATYKDGEYKATCIIPTGIYIINITCSEENNLTIQTATIKNIRGTFTDLNIKVTNAQNNKLDLEYDFAYTPELGDDAYVNGVVINSDLTIDGHGYTISGSNAARIFKVNSGFTLILNNVTVCDGRSDAYGGAIYSEGNLNIKNSEFIENAVVGSVVAPYGDGTRTTTQSFGGAIYIQDGLLSIEGSTFTGNIYNKSAAAWGLGGAVSANNTSSISIKNTIFENNFGFFGGALYIENVAQNEAEIDGCTFINNNALQGGAINIQTDESGQKLTVNIKNSQFIGNGVYSTGLGTIWNDGGAGGAIQAANGPVKLIITDSNFTKNTVNSVNTPGFGGAVYVYGDLEVNGCEFAENEAQVGSAITAGGAPTNTIVIKNTLIKDNVASGNAAFYTWYADVDMDNVTFDGNKAPSIAGIYSYGANLTIKGSKFINNNATNQAGAIYATGNTTIKDSNFTANQAGKNGGAIVNKGTMTVETSNFTNNVAGGLGSAIYNDGELKLSKNKVSSTQADIVSTGTITSTIIIKVMNDGTAYHFANITLQANVTDDNYNPMEITGLNLTVNDTANTQLSVKYNPATGLHEGTYTPIEVGKFNIGASYITTTAQLDITTANITIAKSLIDIQNMINAANAGDTITLDGDYAYIEEFDKTIVNGIVVNKNITIDGKGKTISGSDLARLFNVTAPYTLTLTNVTLTKGNSTKGGAIYSEGNLVINSVDFTSNNVFNTFDDVSETGGSQGGAIYITGGSLQITDSNFIENIATPDNHGDGAAIYADASVLNVTGTTFKSNKGFLGGAVYIKGMTQNTIAFNNCTFDNNTALQGGAIFVEASTTLNINDTIFNENKAISDRYIGKYNDFGAGAAISAADGSNIMVNVTNSKFIKNAVTSNDKSGFGATITSTGSLYIENSLFDQNVAGKDTISVYYGTNSGTVTVINSNFTNNIANEGRAGAIYTNSAKELTVIGSKFENNNAATNGGAIYANGKATIINSTFSGNTAVNGSAIYANNDLTLENNTISKVSADIVLGANGKIISTVKVIILNGEVKTINTLEATLSANVTDDNGNLINDTNFNFTINGEQVPAVYDNGLYKATYTLPFAGIYPVNIMLLIIN